MSFRRRLLFTILAVVVVAQLVTAAATLGTIRHDVVETSARDLDVATNVARQLIEERGGQLADTVEILASDYAFRSAVATQDTDTIGSVLLNHGERAEADLVMLADPQGEVLVGSHWSRGAMFPFDGMWQQALDNQRATGVVVQDGTPYQIILLPVRAPGLIGWVGMGFILDSELAREISSLTRLSVSFLTIPEEHGPAPEDDEYRADDKAPFVAGALSRLSPQALDTLRQSLGAGRYLESATLEEHSDSMTRAKHLQGETAERVYIVVQRASDEVMGIFMELGWQLLGIFALMLLLATVAAGFSARSMAEPLRRLAEAAARIGRGERANLTPEDMAGEPGVLARTLLQMQQDIGERERTLRFQTHHDQLTGIANRYSAQQDIEEGVAGSKPFTLICISLRGFRHINDTFGYATGDFVLRTLAARLGKLPAPFERAYRVAGDEFLLWLSREEAARSWIEALYKRLEAPIMLEDTPIRLSIHSGEVSFPLHGGTAWQLLRRAEIAMDRALPMRLRHLRYLEGQDEQHQRQLVLVRDLQEAASRGQLSMVYQPQIDARSDRVVGMEALMRWQHPSLGFVPPDEFIALAEQSGNIVPLTRWMIDTVCNQMAVWEHEGQRLNVSVNLSAQDVIDPALPRRLADVLNRYRLAPERLGLEVTESAIIHDPIQARETLEELRRTGFRIALDDYGTGYSSLAQIRSLPVGELKIDKSFILRLDSSADDRIIVRSTVELGHNLGLEVVAEGVETEASRKLLSQLGCDHLQGYLISRPIPADAVIDWVSQYYRRVEERKKNSESS